VKIQTFTTIQNLVPIFITLHRHQPTPTLNSSRTPPIPSNWQPEQWTISGNSLMTSSGKTMPILLPPQGGEGSKQSRHRTDGPE